MANKLFPPKRNCAFFNERKIDCNTLTVMDCIKKGKCAFYKTKEEYEEGLRKYSPITNLKDE